MQVSKLRSVFLWVLLISPAFAQADTKGIDVIRWFDGCVALVQEDSGVADQMESNCVGRAFDYCEIGRKVEERPPCISAMTQHLNAQTEALLAERPDTKKLTGFGLREFETYWSTALQKDHPDLCTNAIRVRGMCEPLTAMIRWTSARSALRVWKRYQE